jgi:LDH2 family malate/lactate/ureidoglycolate dehydrogenase
MNTDFSAPQGLGHFFLAMKIEAFLPAGEFAARMEEMIARIKALPPVPGVPEVLYPGEPEARTARDRQQHGVPVSPTTRGALDKLAKEMTIRPLS